MVERAPAIPAGTLIGNAAGVSWQASLFNMFSRNVIKRWVSWAGISNGATHGVITLLEMMSLGLGRLGGVQQRTLAGVPCDVIAPSVPSPSPRTVLYLHGGGFFAHLPHSYTSYARLLADAFGATVYLPDYRLAPEHRYPAATDDCLAVYRALLAEGCDPDRLCVMGDSAGGNLALVTLLRARDDSLPLPACAIVISPGADLTMTGDSYSRNADADPFIPLNALRQVIDQYVDEGQSTHPHASPVLGDFKDLPPIKILVGSTEVLLDSSLSVAKSCHDAGVEVILQIWHEMPHCFPLFGFLPEARSAVRHMAEFFTLHTKMEMMRQPGVLN